MHGNRIGALPDWARELLERKPVARLGFLDGDGRPRVLPITFALAGGRVWTAIDRKPKADPRRSPARVSHLRRNPAIAVTVDHYEDDWERLAWVQLLGRATVIEIEPGRAGSESTAALAALAGKYPAYRAAAPPGPLIRCEIERALHWRASTQ